MNPIVCLALQHLARDLSNIRRTVCEHMRDHPSRWRLTPKGNAMCVGQVPGAPTGGRWFVSRVQMMKVQESSDYDCAGIVDEFGWRSLCV